MRCCRCGGIGIITSRSMPQRLSVTSIQTSASKLIHCVVTV